MSAVYLPGPFDGGSFPLGNHGDPDGPSVEDDEKLFLQVIQIDRPEPYHYVNCHSRGHVSTVFFGVLDSIDIELFIAEGCYLYPLDMLG